jgi:inosine-uridine nucleoside N-ribohydrolase
MTPISVIIDTDPGLGEPGSDIDDGLAIALAIRSPELRVLGITTVNGNVDVSTGTDVARRLTERLGVPDLLVARGAATPLARDMAPVRAMFHAVANEPVQDHHATPGRTKLGPTTAESAADFLGRATRELPGEITVIAIGPMTNIALAIEQDRSFARNVAELVLMAGSATTYAQNVTVVGDFNSYVDPEALDIVIRMVGLDQTSRVMLTRDDAESMRTSEDPFSRWVADCTDAWIDFLGRAVPNRPEYVDACFLHDPLVVASVIEPAICAWDEADVQVETRSELARGLVIADRGLALRPMGAPNARTKECGDRSLQALLSFPQYWLCPAVADPAPVRVQRRFPPN